MSNSFIFNNYIFPLKVIRLTFLAICFLFYFSTISCTNAPQNQPVSEKTEISVAENAININTASAEELEKLPKIGKGIAQKIIEHRERYGKFRKAEHLILVKGMSDKKFREIQSLVKVE
jgi:competence ComEA-like helix-hairpin-helix protein